MNKNINIYCFLTITIFLTSSPTSHAVAVVQSRDEFVIVDGSGALDELDECSSMFVGYDNTFLRGVSEEYFISYNNTAYEDCVRYCCMETHFVCSSFSYFRAIKLCYVMNQTMHEDEAHLARVPGWTHYHKVYPEDETTTIPEYYFTTESASSDSISITNNSASIPDAKTSTGVTKDPLQLSGEYDATTYADDVMISETTSDTDSDQVDYKVTSSPTENDVINTSKTPSTENLKTLSDVTTEEMVADGNDTNYPLDGRAERLQDDLRGLCGGVTGKECQNGGVCSYVSNANDGVAVSSNIMTRCKCPEGFTGEFCELAESDAQEAGIPTYVIALAVIGFFIFVLFAALFVVCCVYKQKSGKYSVKWRRDRWRKKTKKTQTRRSQSFMSDAPFPSRLSDHSFDDAMDSPSSLTSV